MKSTLTLLAVTLFTMGFSSCDFWDKAYVPSQENITARLGRVLPPEGQVAGLYANADVDCLLVRYCVSADSLAAKLQQIQERAIADGWRSVPSNENVIELQRNDVRRNGYEILRVRKHGNCAYVAWLQADGPSTAAEFYRSGEMEWAKDEFWPRFDSSAAGDEDRRTTQ